MTTKVNSQTTDDTATEWWKDGVRFECQGSGKCCTSHGEFGYVFLTKEDRQRFAKHLKIRTAEFTKQYCERTGKIWHLKEDPKQPDCMFLDGKRCGAYEARPTQCRTWPFWPEVMNAKIWATEVKAFCPGVGKGRLIPASEIEENLQAQIDSEMGFGK